MRQGKKPAEVDVPLMFRLWHDSSLRAEDVALALGVSTVTLRKIAARHGLRGRTNPPAPIQFLEAPSPAEDLLSQDSLALSPWVEERARVVRERHFAERRRECDSTSNTRAWRTA